MTRIGSLCTGYGGLDMAVQQVFGGEPAWVSDIDPGARQIITHRMPGVPNIGDLTTARWEDVEPVGIACGGYPCQPFSLAGDLKGTDDARHLWPFIARALRVLRPRIAIFENVANHLRVGFDTVLCDLADLGFDVEWCVVRADEVGAPHQRRRLFILATAADAAHVGHERGGSARGGRPGPANGRLAAADAQGAGRQGAGSEPERCGPERGGTSPAADADRRGRGPDERDVQQGKPDTLWGRVAPAIRRWERLLGRPAPWATDDQSRLSPAFVEWMMGLPDGHVTAVPGLTRTQQLKALGNGVVPQQAAAALRLLADRAGLGVTTR
jgi:DNA (cytosine-5)-methyltransferase 1